MCRAYLNGGRVNFSVFHQADAKLTNIRCCIPMPTISCPLSRRRCCNLLPPQFLTVVPHVRAIFPTLTTRSFLISFLLPLFFCEARFLNYFVSILCVIFDIYLYSIICIRTYIVSRNAFKSRSPVALAPNTIKARIAAVSLMCR